METGMKLSLAAGGSCRQLTRNGSDWLGTRLRLHRHAPTYTGPQQSLSHAAPCVEELVYRSQLGRQVLLSACFQRCMLLDLQQAVVNASIIGPTYCSCWYCSLSIVVSAVQAHLQSCSVMLQHRVPTMMIDDPRTNPALPAGNTIHCSLADIMCYFVGCVGTWFAHIHMLVVVVDGYIANVPSHTVMAPILCQDPQSYFFAAPPPLRFKMMMTTMCFDASPPGTARSLSSCKCSQAC